MVTLALEVFHCFPDELLDRIDAIAERTGRRWQDVIAELLAYYTLKEREEKTAKAQQAIADYFAQADGKRGPIPGTFAK